MTKFMIKRRTDAFKSVTNIDISRQRKTDWFYGVKKLNIVCLVFLCRFHLQKTQSPDSGFETHACKCWQLVKNRYTMYLSLKVLLF